MKPVLPRSRAFWPALVALAAACGLAGTAVLACRDEAPAGIHADPLPASAVNPVLVAFLSKARAAHHRADLAEAEGNRVATIRALTEVVTGKTPEHTPEVKEVLADTYARLGDLESQEGDFDDALDDVQDGLELATEITYFRGHLFEVRGLVEERQAKKLEAKGDDAGAKAARDRASAAFDEAIDVQEQVIDRALTAMASASARPPSPPPSAPPPAKTP
ncbi:MAG: hypothetical protein U0414_14015 [Polyangiaceae bacterium]